MRHLCKINIFCKGPLQFLQTARSKFQICRDLINKPLFETHGRPRYCFLTSGDKTQIYLLYPQITIDDIDIIKHEQARADLSNPSDLQDIEKQWEANELEVFNRDFLGKQKKLIKRALLPCFPFLAEMSTIERGSFSIKSKRSEVEQATTHKQLLRLHKLLLKQYMMLLTIDI